MRLPDYLILALLAVLVFLAIRTSARLKKRGGCCGCSGCSGCNGCNGDCRACAKNEKKTSPDNKPQSDGKA